MPLCSTWQVFRCPDGSLILMALTEACRARHETDAAYFARVGAVERAKAEEQTPELRGAVVVGFTDQALMPPRRWRACWRWAAGRIAVDLPLARVQRLGEIRTERDRRFGALDGEWFKAAGRGDTAAAAAIDARRQALRDVPQVAEQALAALETPEQIADYTPEWPT